YTGTTTIGGGTLQLGVNSALPANTAVTIQGTAVLDLNNLNIAIGSLAGAGAVSFGSGNLTVGSDNTSTTFAGVLSGSGGFTKVGQGTFTLSNSTNSYLGPTTIANGVLAITAGGALGAGGVASGTTIATGKVLQVLGGIAVNEALVL